MKPYKITDNIAKKIKKDFLEKLGAIDITSQSFNFKYSLTIPKKEAKPLKVHCLPTAYHKMQNLVKNTSSEIAWHMIVRKTGKNTLCITDVLVYPQTVTNSTVNTDDVKYPTWLSELDDETFNNLRGQGHSHVNMGISPSSVDTNYYSDLLKTLTSGFYLFIIMNKKDDMFIQAVDVDKNIIYETADIEFEVASNTYNENSWYAEQMVNIETITKRTSYKTETGKSTKKSNESEEDSIWGDLLSGRAYIGGDVYNGFN